MISKENSFFYQISKTKNVNKMESIRISASSHDPNVIICNKNRDSFYSLGLSNKKLVVMFYQEIKIRKLFITTIKSSNSTFALYGKTMETQTRIIAKKIPPNHMYDLGNTYIVNSIIIELETALITAHIVSLELFNDESDQELFEGFLADMKYFLIYSKSNPLSEIIHFNNRFEWYSSLEWKQWVQYWIPYHSLKLCGYSITSGSKNFPLSLKLRASIDGKNWETLNIQVFKENEWKKFQTKYIICGNDCYYKFFRLISYNKAQLSNCFCITGFHLFGDLITEKPEIVRVKQSSLMGHISQSYEVCSSNSFIELPMNSNLIVSVCNESQEIGYLDNSQVQISHILIYENYDPLYIPLNDNNIEKQIDIHTPELSIVLSICSTNAFETMDFQFCDNIESKSQMNEISRSEGASNEPGAEIYFSKDLNEASKNELSDDKSLLLKTSHYVTESECQEENSPQINSEVLKEKSTSSLDDIFENKRADDFHNVKTQNHDIFFEDLSLISDEISKDNSISGYLMNAKTEENENEQRIDEYSPKITEHTQNQTISHINENQGKARLIESRPKSSLFPKFFLDNLNTGSTSESYKFNLQKCRDEHNTISEISISENRHRYHIKDAQITKTEYSDQNQECLKKTESIDCDSVKPITNDAGEEETYSQEEETYSQEEETYSQEEETYSQDEETHNQEEETHSQEEETHNQEEETHNQEEETHNQDEETHNQEEETHNQEEETHNQDEETHNPDEETHNQEEETHNQDEETHNPDEETHNPEEETHNQEEETHNQEEETHNQDEETHNQEEETHNQDEETHNQEEETHNQDEETHNQEEETHNQDEETHNQEEETHNQDEETHNQEEETHNQEEETHNQDEETHNQEEETHNQEEETHNQEEEETHNPDEETHNPDEETHNQDEETHNQDEETHNQDEKTHNQDEETHSQEEDIKNEDMKQQENIDYDFERMGLRVFEEDNQHLNKKNITQKVLLSPQQIVNQLLNDGINESEPSSIDEEPKEISLLSMSKAHQIISSESIENKNEIPHNAVQSPKQLFGALVNDLSLESETDNTKENFEQFPHQDKQSQVDEETRVTEQSSQDSLTIPKSDHFGNYHNSDTHSTLNDTVTYDLLKSPEPITTRPNTPFDDSLYQVPTFIKKVDDDEIIDVNE